ncbi:hypothetical protein EDD16DRAFT_1628976 [Pisolithus croceorrhizus]|nr:hypothetical protein EDD16DRAFT_1628976 [Pisolithus croceorrhizus]
MTILLCDRFFSGKSSEMTPNRSASSCHWSSSGRRNSRGPPASDRIEARNDPSIPRQEMALFFKRSCCPAAKLEFVEIFTPYDKASMERLCAGAYVLWRVRGYLISRILLTFQVNEDKTTTCQMLLIWQYAWRPEFAVEDPSMSETDSNANTPNPILYDVHMDVLHS